MTIYFYDTLNDDRAMPKTLENETEATGTVRGDIDILNPTILIEGDTAIKNYAYIPDFNRYYFVSPPRVIRNGISEITLKVDVLQTYYVGIMNSPIVAERSSNMYNAYIADPNRKFFQYTVNQYIDIGDDIGKPDTPILVTVG
ncbi:MAG: hypothetical protein J6Q61_01135 [Bacteroidales bacterium]|nr:hypothetical protein [Bacteroidales bacterium]